jgi:acetyl esterase/lipase
MNQAKPASTVCWTNGEPFPIWTEDEMAARAAQLGEFVPTLTPVLLPGDTPRGLVLVFPGGGYSGRAPHEHRPVAECFNHFGFHGAVLDYRTANSCPTPLGLGPWEDAQRAVRLVRLFAADWHVKPDKIAVLGFSAGGHLCAWAATRFSAGDPGAAHPADRLSGRPDAAIPCYAVISAGSFGHAGSIQNLAGQAPTPEQIEFFSNERHVTAQTPPMFLWHTANDGGVPVENSLCMAQALRDAKVPFALHVYPSGNHGLGLAANAPLVKSWPELCAAWLRDLGF